MGEQATHVLNVSVRTLPHYVRTLPHTVQKPAAPLRLVRPEEASWISSLGPHGPAAYDTAPSYCDPAD